MIQQQTTNYNKQQITVGAKTLTLAAGGKHEDFWVFLTHPVDHVYLLQSLSDCIFVLRITGNVGRPELRAQQRRT